MKKCLIATHGFIGDIIFASSIAKKLKEENQFQIVDYLIGFPQVYSLLNEYITDGEIIESIRNQRWYANKVGKDFTTVKIDETFPKYLINNLNKFKDNIDES